MVKTNVQPGARLLGLAAALLMLLGLAGCGVQITSAALPQSATLEKGDTVQMEVDFGTENQAEAEAIAASCSPGGSAATGSRTAACCEYE